MNRRWTALALSASLISLGGSAACGGIAVIDPDNNGQGGNGQGGATSSTTSTTSGGDAMEIRIVSALASANCLPPTGPDPLGLAFTLEFDNGAGSASSEATIDSARITSGMLSTSFGVTPIASGVVGAGSTAEVDFNKSPNSANGDSGCSYCTLTDTRLELSLTTGGQTVNIDELINSVSCSF